MSKGNEEGESLYSLLDDIMLKGDAQCWLLLGVRPRAVALRLRQCFCSTASGGGDPGAEGTASGKGEGGDPGAEGKGKEISTTTASLRLDAVAASGLDISRK